MAQFGAGVTMAQASSVLGRAVRFTRHRSKSNLRPRGQLSPEASRLLVGAGSSVCAARMARSGAGATIPSEAWATEPAAPTRGRAILFKSRPVLAPILDRWTVFTAGTIRFARLG